MRKLHICFVSQEYPPDTGWGGIGSYTYEMARGLVHAGHRVSVISRAVAEEKVTSEGGVEVHRVLPTPDWSRRRGLWRLNRVWPGFAWAAMLRLRAIHRHTSVDLVEAAEGRADSFFVSLLRHRPRVVVRLHTAWIFVDRLNDVLPDRKKRFMYWLERRAIRQADLITSPCQAMIDLTKTWVSLSAQPAVVIPNPVDTTVFAPAPTPRHPEVLFVSRLERRKGIETLIQAMPSVLQKSPTSTFRFVGSDGTDTTGRSWRDRLRAAVPNTDGERVQFDHVGRDQLITAYNRAAVSVLPSLWENFPYALLEAMACGTPVVATKTGGLPELVDDGHSGLLIAPDDADALTDALCDMLENSQQRSVMGQNARMRAEQCFSTRRIVSRMLEVYYAALDTPRKRGAIAWPA
jgi:glycosyltransferase involved in cell wall biosynthesis